jgi:NitT/TauT family transport system substrate-binding protein
MSRRTRRGRPAAAFAAMALLLACSPGGGSGPAAPAAAPPPPTGASAAPHAAASPPAPLKARSAYTSINAVCAPWWMAQEAGYFREQGLDVELGHIDPGVSLAAAMHNGELDVTFGAGPTLALGFLQGLDVVVIGATSSSLDSVLFARPDLQSVEDLRGKTIGVNRIKSLGDVTARLMLQRGGLQPDVDVFTRGTGGQAEALAALQIGAVDGISVSPPVVFEARKLGYRELLSAPDLGISFLSGGVGATRRVLAERPALGERYLRALAQANRRLITDREYAMAVLGKYAQMDDRDQLGATVDYFRGQYTLDPYPEPAALQAVLDAEENPAARTARPADFTDYRYAEQLRASGYLDTLPRP